MSSTSGDLECGAVRETLLHKPWMVWLFFGRRGHGPTPSEWSEKEAMTLWVVRTCHCDMEKFELVTTDLLVYNIANYATSYEYVCRHPDVFQKEVGATFGNQSSDGENHWRRSSWNCVAKPNWFSSWQSALLESFILQAQGAQEFIFKIKSFVFSKFNFQMFRNGLPWWKICNFQDEISSCVDLCALLISSQSCHSVHLHCVNSVRCRCFCFTEPTHICFGGDHNRFYGCL